jgi:hypothetical protein
MANDMESAGLCSATLILSTYDQRTDTAMRRFLDTLAPTSVDDAVKAITTASTHALDSWNAMMTGEDPAADATPSNTLSRGLGSSLTPDSGTSDQEHPHAPVGRSMRLQHSLQCIVDAGCHQGLLHHLREANDDGAWRRLTDLAHAGVEHTWLWRLNKHQGSTLEETDYVDAIRLRLGSGGPTEAITCAHCGNKPLGPSGSHAMCCSTGEATRGHNKVVEVILNRIHAVDPNAEAEVRGLISKTNLRPADILTTTIGPAQTALDVSITSPDRIDAGADCVDTRFKQKIDRYSAHLPELRGQGIDYTPIVWSCFGRPHPEAKRVLHAIARTTARRRGGTNAEEIYSRIMADINVEIWRRNVMQLRSCWPTPDDSLSPGQDDD